MKLNEIIHRIKKQNPEEYDEVSLAEWCGVVNVINKRIYDNITAKEKKEDNLDNESKTFKSIDNFFHDKILLCYDLILTF